MGVACGVCGRGLCVGGALGAVWGRGQTWAWLVGLWAGPQRCSLERLQSVGVACVGGALCALWGRGQTWAWLVGVGGTTTVLIGERAVGGRGLWVCGRGLCVGGGLGAVWGCGLMWAWFVGVGGGATAVLIGEKAVGGRGLWVCGRGLCGCGLRCNVGAWSGVAWAWLSVCGRGLIVPI